MSSADIKIFYPRLVTFEISSNPNMIAFSYIVSSSFNVFQSLKVILIKMVAILMM